MAIQGSGQIKLTELATEFGGTAPYSLKAYYRGGGRVPSNNTNVPASGAIGLKNFYSAVNRIALTVTLGANTTETSLTSATVPGYIAGITDLTVYVSSGVYVYSTNTANPALTLGTGFAAGDTITLVNNGFILGMGGNGASGSHVSQSLAATNGGPAMSLGYNISLTNNSYIAGGGGGGGGRPGGGGAGGGAGGDLLTGPGDLAAAGGAGGGPGAAGSNGGIAPSVSGGGQSTNAGSGAGGGRLLPGTGGAGGINLGDGVINVDTAAQGGGAGGGSGASQGLIAGSTLRISAGGGGGGWGAAGGSGIEVTTGPSTGTPVCANGGSSNSAGGNASSPSAGIGGQIFTTGGAGGKAINLNGYTVTYLTTGTLYGTVS